MEKQSGDEMVTNFLKENSIKIIEELAGGNKHLHIRTGELPKIKDPMKVEIQGVLDSPVKWLEKRIDYIEEGNSHITVDREQMNIVLIDEETNPYRTVIVGTLEYHPVFLALGINQGDYLTPVSMAELLKKYRSYFENKDQAMGLVSQLRSFKAHIQKKVDTEFNPNTGDKRSFISREVDSNLPPSFVVEVPIFKGDSKTRLVVETYFNPDDLTCTLVSPDATDQIEQTRDDRIDAVLAKIREIAPEIAIIEI